MRIAVLGVGLIGGSIGMAARARAGAEVIGFDPDQACLEEAMRMGAIDTAASSIEEACAEAELVFCAGPVSELRGLVEESLDYSSLETVVTDVGSVKRHVVGSTSDKRFIGGHPLAGAETSGVSGARENLFDGARWYLTPQPTTSGLLYDRLQGLIADMGGRPQAIDAEAHDRLMATTSHLPHVLSNVLVDQATLSVLTEADRLPDVGPSLRDAVRVAGANPAIWRDIFDANREAIAEAIDDAVVGLRKASRLIRSGELHEIAAWHAAAGDDRQRLLATDAGGVLHELRVQVENKPGTIAELALALGRAGVNIEDMALYPAQDMRTGAVTLWVAGSEQAERAAELVRGLGHSVTVLGGDG